jgi:hypothetical protein
MYKFMRSEGIKQATILYHVRGLSKAADQDGAAKKCKEGMAKAEPMRVWGRAKRHNKMGKGILLLFLDDTDDDMNEEEEEEEEEEDVSVVMSTTIAAAAVAVPSSGSRAEETV